MRDTISPAMRHAFRDASHWAGRCCTARWADPIHAAIGGGWPQAPVVSPFVRRALARELPAKELGR